MFHDRVAATYCWAAREHELPRLLFTARERGSAADSERIQEFSCPTGGWAKEHKAERFELDSSVYDEL
jgi:hypothetical protein